MSSAVQIKGKESASVVERMVVKTITGTTKTKCFFSDGTHIVVSNLLGSFIYAGDELHFPVDLQTADASTQIYIRDSNIQQRRDDAFQSGIGYATQPKRDKRGDLFVSAEVNGGGIGIRAIHLPCEVLKDHFYVGNRRRVWERQPSFYALLKVSANATPTDLRLAFKLRTLELRQAHAPVGEIRSAERAFNILACPELRACYDALLRDPASPTLFPYGGFGCLLARGHCLRDGTVFYASRILAFLPERTTTQMHLPLRKCTFYRDRAIYRDVRRKYEIMFDQCALPLSWDPDWNQWKHLLSAKAEVKAALVQSGIYQRRGEAWHLVKWQTALPSRIDVTLPTNIAEQINDARHTYHRFGQFSDALDRIRVRTESEPIERGELQKLCAELGVPGDFDVALITWKADYDSFYYKQLCKRARRLYLFRSEYIFDVEKSVIVEIPQLGHATYVFSKALSMNQFLRLYARARRDNILQNRNNVAEKLGFLGRIIHGHEPHAWLKELKLRLNEDKDYADISE